MCSEISSPRLSFSSDIGEGQSDDVLPLQDTSVLDMACEFEFSFSCGLSAQESSSADELFSHGIILPTQPRESTNNNKSNYFSSSSYSSRSNITKSLPPLPSFPENNHHHHPSKREKANKAQPKSFWGTFKRSTSLNCESKRSSGLLSSLPLLSRSNSTGSVQNQNKRSAFKEPIKTNTYSSSSSLSSFYAMPPQKPPLKKGYGGSYGNGVRIIPVINLPPPYISKGTAKLFGLGSFLSPGKDRKTKK